MVDYIDSSVLSHVSGRALLRRVGWRTLWYSTRCPFRARLLIFGLRSPLPSKNERLRRRLLQPFRRGGFPSLGARCLLRGPSLPRSAALQKPRVECVLRPFRWGDDSFKTRSQSLHYTWGTKADMPTVPLSLDMKIYGELCDACAICWWPRAFFSSACGTHLDSTKRGCTIAGWRPAQPVGDRKQIAAFQGDFQQRMCQPKYYTRRRHGA